MGADSTTAVRLAAFSFLAIPVCYVLSLIDELTHNHALLFVVAIAALAGLGFAAHYVVFGGKKQPWYLYVLSVMCFTTIVDLVLVLTIEGAITTGDFYFKGGEPYLDLAHGAAINWWDCTIHFALYVYIISCLVKNDWNSAKPAVLYYVGSIMNSLFVFLPGNVTGPFGDRITLSYLLNVPFIFIPIWLAYSALKRIAAPVNVSSPARGRHSSSSSPRRTTAPQARARHGDGILRTILIISAVVSIGVLVVRVMAVVGASPNAFVQSWTSMEPFLLDPASYPRWQAITFFFYLVPYFGIVVYTLAVSSMPPAWLFDLSVLAAGAAMQGEFAMLGSALHWKAHASARVALASPHFLRMVLLNINIAALPHVVAGYAHIRASVKRN